MDLGVFYEVIVPLMEMRGAATICISTPVSSWNFYTELTEIRDDKGELLFNVIKVGMVCGRCEGTERESECTHPTGDRPEWKTETSEKVRAIYGHRKTLMLREVMGKVADDENMAFEARDLKAFFRRKECGEPHQDVSEVYVSLDPNGGASSEGGTGSQSAIVSFFTNGANVVVRALALHARRALHARVRLGVVRIENDSSSETRLTLNGASGGFEWIGRHERNVIGVDLSHKRADAPRASGAHVVVHFAQPTPIVTKGRAIDERRVDGSFAFGVGIGHVGTKPPRHVGLDQHGPVDGKHLHLFADRRSFERQAKKATEHVARKDVVGILEFARIALGERCAQTSDKSSTVVRVSRQNHRRHAVVGAHASQQDASAMMHGVEMLVPLASMRHIVVTASVGRRRRRRRFSSRCGGTHLSDSLLALSTDRWSRELRLPKYDCHRRLVRDADLTRHRQAIRRRAN